jgi:large subunit ribosomal protein L16
MGKGKGSVDHWVAVVKPGRIIFEIADVPTDIALQALRSAAISCRSKRKSSRVRRLCNG